MNNKVLGIDLGTTNTVCAVMEGGEPTMIQDEDLNINIPSVVSFDDEQNKIVGRAAINQAVNAPGRTVSSVKRYMGRRDHTFNVGFDEFKPEEISSMILRRIKNIATEHIGEEINDAVITVPAYFTDKQRKATRRAGEIAGFNVRKIINEPTAAAMAYGIDKNQNQKILVADLGGGTFDVTILDLGKGLYDVEATDGVRHLGEDDWDKAIVDHVAEQFEEQNSINLLNQPDAKERLFQEAEKAKKELTTRHKATIDIPFITTNSDKPLHLKHEITRETFEKITTDLRRKLENPINDSLDRANIRKREISNVILVGGATKMPQIRRKIRNTLGMEPLTNISTNEVVATGAAIQGGIISGEKDDVVLLDVTPQTLGIEIKGGLFEEIIPKNTTIPTKRKKLYTTSVDNQKTVEINVYQGEHDIAKKNEKLGEFVLRGIPNMEAGEPRITVEFEIDADGIVTVKTKEAQSDRSQSIRIDRENRIGEEDIESMKLKSEQYEEAALSKKERINITRNADRQIVQAKKILARRDDMDASKALEIEKRKEKLDAKLSNENATSSEVRRATIELENIVGPYTENTEDKQTA